jgi:hypothetical protein
LEPNLHSGYSTLHEHPYRWTDPYQAVPQIDRSLASASNEHLRHRFLQEWTIEAFPDKGSTTYTEATFLQQFEHSDKPIYVFQGAFNVVGLLGMEYPHDPMGRTLVQMINDGDLHEIWIYAPPASQMPESAMAGPNAYHVNGPIYSHPDLEDQVVLMMYSYERSMAEALEIYGHRFESILWHQYPPRPQTAMPGTPTALAPTPTPSIFEHFQMKHRHAPGLGSVGDSHLAFNARQGRNYDRVNMGEVATDHADWYQFPWFTGNRPSEGCSGHEAWGCTDLGYLQWWYDHVPKSYGSSYNGVHNWWPMIARPACLVQP